MCIQESNFKSSSFRIPTFYYLFSVQESDRTHSWSGSFSPDDSHASDGVIIFVSKSLSFLSFQSPFCLHLTSTLTTLGSIFCSSFVKIYAPPIYFSLADIRADYFFPKIFILESEFSQESSFLFSILQNQASLFF